MGVVAVAEVVVGTFCLRHPRRRIRAFGVEASSSGGGFSKNRQEVDQLLNKTRFDMHATMQQQQGGRSPKAMNGLISASQLKTSPWSMQTSAGSFSSQSKGKKRERSDQVSEPSKRDRVSRSEDGDVGPLKAESLLKSEIARITERGGLVSFEGVERLIQLTQSEKNERKTGWNSRSLLAGVIAATDRFDCLSRFMQLRGLVVLDECLQEVHKSKAGDASSRKDSGRSVDEFLWVLLCALDKLPVNLNALQTCNIGKSVNHLRSNRNSEIQKKARSLVDTWEKQVEAEMNMSDTKSGPGQAVPLSARSRPEVSHSGNRQTGGASNVVLRSVTPVSSPRSAPVKLIQLDSNGKSSAASPGPLETSVPASPNANSREQPKISVAVPVLEPSQTAARDEKSSSSGHSHTNSQGSSEHGRNLVPSGKDDARSSLAGSSGMSKVSGSASRYQRSPNGLMRHLVMFPQGKLDLTEILLQ